MPWAHVTAPSSFPARRHAAFVLQGAPEGLEELGAEVKDDSDTALVAAQLARALQEQQKVPCCACWAVL